MKKKIIFGIIAVHIIAAVVWNNWPKGYLYLAPDGVFELGGEVDFSNSAKILFDNGTSETIFIRFDDSYKIEIAAGTWQLIRTNAGPFSFYSTTTNGSSIDNLTPNLISKEYYVYNPRLKLKHFLKSVSYGAGVTYERADDPGYEIAPNEKFFVVKNQYHTLPVDYFLLKLPKQLNPIMELIRPFTF